MPSTTADGTITHKRFAPLCRPVLGSPGTTLLAVSLPTQVGAVIVSLISVTLPLRANNLPLIVAPLATEMEFKARIVPTKLAVVPKSAVSTRQKTLQA